MSNNTKWTKGPWYVFWANKNIVCLGHEENRLSVPVNLNYTNGACGPNYNAFLIASAPDGYALAELVMDICGNPKGISESKQDELYEAALQYSKKARGEIRGHN